MSESSNDKLVEIAYDGAAGASLFAEGKYDEAITHLEEDPQQSAVVEVAGRGVSKDWIQRRS